MDYTRPVEAVIPGATGRLLAALAQVEAELPVSTLASIAGVGRTRASGIIDELSDLGIVERREIGRTVMVSLVRHSVAGELIDRLAHLGSEVIARLRALASALEPAPETLLVFGSFARGEADSHSDLDILAVGALLGQRAGGEHIEGLSLLATSGDDGRYAARQLSQLLRFKTPAQYDPAPLPENDARKAVELARPLAERASVVTERRRP